MGKKSSSFITKLRRRLTVKNLLYYGLPSVAIMLFCKNYLFTGTALSGGDFDYFAQIYEAFRTSVVHFHQFPWWNPWMAGGTLLFANPQFGLVSIQTPFVLAFGTIVGLKLAFIVYYLIGFWGMYLVARRIALASYWRAVLIAGIWITCGFFSHHGINHYTFALFQFFPWLFYLFVQRDIGRNWLWFALIFSLMALTALHYALIMIGVVFILYWIVDNLRGKFTKQKAMISLAITKIDLLFALKVTGVILLLAGYRIALTYLNIHEFPRPDATLFEPPASLQTIFTALFLPAHFYTILPETFWGWGEYSAYLGIGTGLAIAFAATVFVGHILQRKITRVWWDKTLQTYRPIFIFAVIGVISFLITLGNTGTFSPANILQQLPGFGEARVFSRWLIFVVFALLLILAAVKYSRRWMNTVFTLLLIAGALELGISFHNFHQFNGPSAPPSQYTRPFEQYDNNRNHAGGRGEALFDNPKFSYFYTTTQNRGQIIADDALVNTLDTYHTQRCGINKNPYCTFVLSGNAELVKWTPNEFVLRRSAPGEIIINSNPSSAWEINNERPFSHFRQTESNKNFIIADDGKEEYIVKFIPRFSLRGIL